MQTKRLYVIALSLVALATLPAYGQFPAKGNDSTGSYGSFQIQVNPKFAALFAGCPAYNGGSGILQSPDLYDSATVIGRSNVIKEDDPNDASGVPVGNANTVIGDNSLSHIFPAPKGTREIHTEIRELKMSTYPAGSGPLMVVRAGEYYNNAGAKSPPPPGAVSGGEVKSESGNSGNPAKDFPANSFFDVYVQVDLPNCGAFPGGTVFNKKPLIVKAEHLNQLPPKVVYLHDASITAVPILFAEDHGALWHRNQVAGCIVLAGHGVGINPEQFNSVMRRQRGGRCAAGMLEPPGKPGIPVRKMPPVKVPR